jgi:hypothetical protein
MSVSVIAYGIIKRSNPSVQFNYRTFGFGPPDWGLFLRLYRQHLMGFCQNGPRATSWLHPWLFWPPVAALLLLGSWALIRRRCWERLAIVVGWLAALVGYHLVVGPGGFYYNLDRYGFFLTVPLALSFAVLAEGLLVRPITPRSAAARRVQVVVLLAVGYVLIGSYKVNYFDSFARGADRGESFWTLRTEAIEPYQLISAIIDRDMARTGRDRAVVLAEDWWCHKPVEFFLARRPGATVVCLDPVHPALAADLIRRKMEAGAYVVAYVGKPFEAVALAGLDPTTLQHWHVWSDSWGCYVVYRLKRDPDEADGCRFCVATARADGRRRSR